MARKTTRRRPARRAPTRARRRSTRSRKPVIRYRTKIKRVRVRRNPRGMLSQPAVRFGLAAVFGAIVGQALDRSVLAGRVGGLRPSLAVAAITGLLSRSKLIKGAGNKALAMGGAVGMAYPTIAEYAAAPVAGLVDAVAAPIAGMLPASSGISSDALITAPQGNTLASIGAARR